MPGTLLSGITKNQWQGALQMTSVLPKTTRQMKRLRSVQFDSCDIIGWKSVTAALIGQAGIVQQPSSVYDIECFRNLFSGK